MVVEKDKTRKSKKPSEKGILRQQRKEKKERALARKEARDERTDNQQLTALDRRGAKAQKERARLMKRIREAAERAAETKKEQDKKKQGRRKRRIK